MNGLPWGTMNDWLRLEVDERAARLPADVLADVELRRVATAPTKPITSLAPASRCADCEPVTTAAA